MRLCKSSLIAKLIILAVMIYAIVTIVSLRPKIDTLEQERDSLSAEVSALQQSNTEIASDISALGSDASIIEIARERLNLVLEDEIIYIDSSN